MNRDIELFQDPDLSWVIDRIVQRLERGLEIKGKITKSNVSPEERRAVDDLLGRKSTTGSSLSVDLCALGERYHLETIVQSIRGPIINLRAQQNAESESWNQLAAYWHTNTQNHTWANSWLDGLFTVGLLKRMTGRDIEWADRLINQAWEILSCSSHDDILLASLAAKITGDSHALDRGKPLANLCLRGIDSREDIDGSTSADARREAWSSIGVIIDDLSAPVLCLNLRAYAGTDLAPWIDWHVARGEPYYLPWRQVKKFVPVDENQTIYVCENPSVISEAAHRLGSGSHPLICMNGLPSAAVKSLVRKVGEQSNQVYLRADFDWAGIKFVDQMRRATGIDQLWRMDSETYANCSPSQSLKGVAYAPPWAANLVTAMTAKGMAVFEEEIIDILIDDLKAGSGLED